jgi:hypothetical protein
VTGLFADSDKLQHWRAFPGTFASKGAPMLEFRFGFVRQDRSSIKRRGIVGNDINGLGSHRS